MNYFSTIIPIALMITSCDSEKWKPYVEDAKSPINSISPNVEFETILDCQSYLVNRFGKTNYDHTFYCLTECESKTEPEVGYFNLGDFQCPKTKAQIVGQTISTSSNKGQQN